MTPVARSRVEPVVGDPARIAALEAAEQRLGVTLPDDYRRFVADRTRYHVMVKRMSFHWIEAANGVKLLEPNITTCRSRPTLLNA